MKRPHASIVVTMTLPFVVGCMGVIAQPVPEPIERAATEIVGVVVGEEPEGERIEFTRVDRVQWSNLSVTITGVRGTDMNAVETRSFEIPDLSGVLVRGVDPTKSSLIVAGVLMTAAVITTLVVTGKTEEGTVLPPGPGS